MRIKAALYNADHLEYGLVTIPFPIPQDQYNDTIKMLEALDIGDRGQRIVWWRRSKAAFPV